MVKWNYSVVEKHEQPDKYIGLWIDQTGKEMKELKLDSGKA